jgi:hypothetical protein
MAYLDKEVYERKAAYAERKMRKNAEVETLTEEQHEALSDICRIRHMMHSNMACGLYYTNSSDYNNWDYIDTACCENNLIKEIIDNAQLPEWDWKFDMSDVTMDYDLSLSDFDDDENEYNAAADKAISAISRIIERWNSSIESYLKKIDEEHGTEYCPNGSSRIF